VGVEENTPLQTHSTVATIHITTVIPDFYDSMMTAILTDSIARSIK